MRRLFRHIAITLILAWLPLNAVAAAALPDCAGHLAGGSVSGDVSPGLGDGHHGHAPGGDSERNPASPDAAFCGLCGLCHQSGQVHALSAFVAAPMVPAGWQAAPLSSLPPGFFPDPLRRPPRG